MSVWRVYTPQRPRRRPAARWSKTFARFLSKNLGVSLKPTLDLVATTNACASLLTKTLGVDRSNPCGLLFPELRVRLTRQRRDMSSCENSSQVADQSASHSRTLE
jgi:hypothetical protein